MRLLAILALASLALAGCGGATAPPPPPPRRWSMPPPPSPPPPPPPEIIRTPATQTMGTPPPEIRPAGTGTAAGREAPPAAAAPSAAADPLVYCDVTNDRIRASDCAYNREVFGRLDRGRAALDIPQRMTRGQPEQISFALTRAAEGLPNEVENPQEYLDTRAEVARSVRVGRRMGVKLEGVGFTIAPEGLIERDLLAGGGARWNWTVTPTHHGRRRLTATAYAIVTAANGRRSERLLKTFSQEVEIVVRRGDRARDTLKEAKGWFELSTEVLLALAALIGTGLYGLWVAIRKFRRGKGEGASAGAGGAS